MKFTPPVEARFTPLDKPKPSAKGRHQVKRTAINRLSATCLTIVVIATPMLACAQQKARPDPADPAGAAPAPTYDSAYRTYVPQREVKPVAWRDINDEMGRLGGNTGHTRDSADPATPAPATVPANKPPAQQTKPAAGGRAGNHK